MGRAADRQPAHAPPGRPREAQVSATAVQPPFLGAGYTRAFNAIFPELAAKYGLPFYPFLLAGVAGNSRLNLPDRVHPNAAGIARMAKGVAPYVLRAVAG